STGWVALFGEFEASPEQVRFIGKRVPVGRQPGAPEPEEKDRPGVGLVLSSMSLADGVLSAEVEFENITPDSICELAIAYDSNATHIVTAGLGSEPWAMFGIREFGVPKEQTWWDHRVGGDRANLKPGRTYRIEVRLRGASVALHVD